MFPKERFITYFTRIKHEGYSAVSIDDVAHMVIHPSYPLALKKKLRDFERYYTQLVKLARRSGLDVFVNMDLMYYHKSTRHLRGDHRASTTFLEESLQLLFENYDVKGIISRFGESDGVDVKGWFRSERLLDRLLYNPFILRYVLKKK